MATWAKIVIRSVGVLNSAVLLLGLSFLAESVYKTAIGQIRPRGAEPYFYVAFATMAAAEIVFVSVFLVASFRFVRGNLSAVNPYSIAVLLYFAYFVTSGMAWRLGGGVGASVAAVTAVSSGTAPFALLLCLIYPMPFPLYPAVTVVLVQLVKWRGVQLNSSARA